MEAPSLSLALNTAETTTFGDVGGTSFGNSGFTYTPAAQNNMPYIVAGIVALVIAVLLLRK